jgi:spore maturation protein CgeB
MVFAGQAGTGDTGAEVIAGFRELGWAVQEVNLKNYLVKSSGDFISRLTSRVIRERLLNSYHREILKVCREFRPDFLMTVKGQFMPRSLLHDIKKMGTRIFGYYPDVDFNHPGMHEDSFLEYDFFFSTKRFHVKHMSERIGGDRVAYIPHGYSQSVILPIYTDISDSERETDVVYAGNHSVYKQEWLETLSRLQPDLRLAIIGNRWQAADRGRLKNAAILGERVHCSYAEAIQSARIAVAVHFGKTRSGWEDSVSKRTFEIPACRGFMLHIDNEEVRDFFEPGTEIDVFSSPEELADKIGFYLPRPELREKMVERAYNRAVPAYSFKQRARLIAEKLAA